MDPREQAELEARAEHETHLHDWRDDMAAQFEMDRGLAHLDALAASGFYDEDITP